MNSRIRNLRFAGLALVGCAAATTVFAQAVGSEATNGTVVDATGSVLVKRGARSFPAARGTSLQPGDQVFVLDGSSLTLACTGEDAVRITTVGTFTYSGCQQRALAAAAPVPSTTTPVVGAPQPSPLPQPAVAAEPKKGGGGATLGIIGGLAVLAAAAGGGGGGGKSSSP